MAGLGTNEKAGAGTPHGVPETGIRVGSSQPGEPGGQGMIDRLMPRFTQKQPVTVGQSGAAPVSAAVATVDDVLDVEAA